ncbi:MAG: hypothetical protein ABSC06_05175, partial [Rhodopila sp.]
MSDETHISRLESPVAAVSVGRSNPGIRPQPPQVSTVLDPYHHPPNIEQEIILDKLGQLAYNPQTPPSKRPQPMSLPATIAKAIVETLIGRLAPLFLAAAGA